MVAETLPEMGDGDLNADDGDHIADDGDRNADEGEGSADEFAKEDGLVRGVSSLELGVRSTASCGEGLNAWMEDGVGAVSRCELQMPSLSTFKTPHTEQFLTQRGTQRQRRRFLPLSAAVLQRVFSARDVRHFPVKGKNNGAFIVVVYLNSVHACPGNRASNFCRELISAAFALKAATLHAVPAVLQVVSHVSRNSPKIHLSPLHRTMPASSQSS